MLWLFVLNIQEIEFFSILHSKSDAADATGGCVPRDNLVSLLPRRFSFTPPVFFYQNTWVFSRGWCLQIWPLVLLPRSQERNARSARDGETEEWMTPYPITCHLYAGPAATWGDHMRQAITWEKILITAEVEHASDLPPPPPATSTLPTPRLRPGLYFLKWRRLKHCGIYSVNTLIRRETSWKGYFQARNQSRIHRYKWDLRGNTICAREMDYSLAHGWLIQQPTLISGGRREVLTGFDREHI